jgi:hypothetical protein
MRIGPKFLISLPILALPWLFPLTPVQAQDFGPAEATEHLAKARALDAKCRYLSEADHNELSDYVAKAEIVVANDQGVEAASSAVRMGKLTGEQMNCAPEGEEMVRATYAAGKQAMETANAAPAKEEPAPQKKRNQAQILGAMSDDQLEMRSPTDPARSENSLARYRNEATAYYLELRCRSLSNREVRDFWRRIVSRHESMISAYGRGPVVRARVEAERTAARRPCIGSGSFIESAYANMR